MSIKHIYILANDSYIFLFNLKSVSKFEDKCFASFFFLQNSFVTLKL